MFNQLPFGIADLLSHPDVQQAIMGSQQAPTPAPEETMAPDIVSQAPRKHKGMFGIHGLARDIIGTLGDAYLTSRGDKPRYQDVRDREKISDVLGGSQDFIHNPLQAIQNLNNAGFPDQAQELYKNYVATSIQQATAARQQEDADYKVKQRAASILGAVKPDGSNYAATKALYDRYLQSHGLSADVPLPDNYDEAAINQARYYAYPVDKQMDDEATRDYRARMVPIAQQRADAASQNARTNEKSGDVRNWTGVANAYSRVASVQQGDRRTTVYEQHPPGSGKNRQMGGGAGQRIVGGHDATKVPPGTPITSASGVTLHSDGKVWK